MARPGDRQLAHSEVQAKIDKVLWRWERGKQ
jgi:hypothetical protein